MASEDLSAANGTTDSPPVSNGLPSEKPQTVTLDAEKQVEDDSDDELETPNGSEGSDDAIKILHEEIQGLRRERSELQRRMEELLAEMERSEVGTKALAAHASYLEGELFRTQEDLASASSVAMDAEGDASRLRSEIKNLENEKESIKKKLEEKIADLEMERGRKEGEIRVLKEELRVSEERRAITEEELKKRTKELELRIHQLATETRKAMEEEANIRVSREDELARVVKVMKEKNSELEGDLVHQKTRREEELEKTVKELKESNSELEERVAELSSKEKVSTDERSWEMESLMAASASKVSWAVAAAAAVSTGTVAIAVTAFYLRHGKQRWLLI